MQLKTLIGLLRKEIPFTEETQQELKELVEEYPYFQIGHLLYTLNLYEMKDSHFPVQLRKTAAYLFNRKQLLFQLESAFFDPEKIRKLEAKEEVKLSSFDLINFFLNPDTQPEHTTPAKEEDSYIKEEDTRKRIASTDYLSLLLSEESEAPTVESPEMQPLKFQDKIDRFIREDEKAPIKIELKEEDQLSEDEMPMNVSEVEKDSFLSETLAKIYIKQKKYDKALKIIQELDLLYPEKNRYFADQIRFLEKLIINTQKI